MTAPQGKPPLSPVKGTFHKRQLVHSSFGAHYKPDGIAVLPQAQKLIRITLIGPVLGQKHRPFRTSTHPMAVGQTTWGQDKLQGTATPQRDMSTTQDISVF